MSQEFVKESSWTGDFPYFCVNLHQGIVLGLTWPLCIIPRQ